MIKIAKEKETKLILQSIKKWCKKLGIDEYLTISLACKESLGKQDNMRLEGKGINNLTIGAFQIKVGTARMMGFKGDPAELLNIDTNVEYGLKYLKYCLKKHKNSVPYALAEYNAGKIKLDSFGGFKNREYIDDIIVIRKLLKQKETTATRIISAWYRPIPELYKFI